MKGISKDRAALEAARATPALRRIGIEAEHAGAAAYLVGGAVRDLLLGRALGDLDLAVEGDIDPLLEALPSPALRHDRFGTATVELDGRRVDLARCRRERYPEPGALPEVEPAPIRADLARRDFTVNAIAIPLSGELELIDPYDGVDDLGRGLLRVLHDASFADDPTRAVRAARYAGRLGLTLEAGTEELLRAADTTTVSRDRLEAELERLVAEPTAVESMALLAEWGILDLEPGGRALAVAAEVDRVGSEPPWDAEGLRGRALLGLAAEGRALGEAERLAELEPERPSQAVSLAAGLARRPEVLLIARAAGAGWLDRWLTDWRHVRLEIDGDDLIESGLEPGPAIGEALEGALRQVLDGEIGGGRDEQLRAALAIAEGGPAR